MVDHMTCSLLYGFCDGGMVACTEVFCVGDGKLECETCSKSHIVNSDSQHYPHTTGDMGISFVVM